MQETAQPLHEVLQLCILRRLHGLCRLRVPHAGAGGSIRRVPCPFQKEGGASELSLRKFRSTNGLKFVNIGGEGIARVGCNLLASYRYATQVCDRLQAVREDMPRHWCTSLCHHDSDQYRLPEICYFIGYNV